MVWRRRGQRFVALFPHQPERTPSQLNTTQCNTRSTSPTHSQTSNTLTNTTQYNTLTHRRRTPHAHQRPTHSHNTTQPTHQNRGQGARPERGHRHRARNAGAHEVDCLGGHGLSDIASYDCMWRFSAWLLWRRAGGWAGRRCMHGCKQRLGWWPRVD